MNHMQKIYRDNFDKVLILIGIVIAITVTFTGNFINVNGELSPTILSHYGGFIGGTVGIFFSLAGYLIINKSFLIQKKQSFENLFFSTFREFNEFRTKQIGLLYLAPEKATTDEPRELHSGYEFFETIFYTTLGFKEENDGKDKTTEQKIKTVFTQNKSQMAHYFSHLNMLIYSVENATLNKENKIFFMKYLECQLSEQEKFLIYFYKLHPENANFEMLKFLDIGDKDSFENLVEK